MRQQFYSFLFPLQSCRMMVFHYFTALLPIYVLCLLTSIRIALFSDKAAVDHEITVDDTLIAGMGSL